MIKVTAEEKWNNQKSSVWQQIWVGGGGWWGWRSRGEAASDQACCEVTGSVVLSVKGQERRGFLKNLY